MTIRFLTRLTFVVFCMVRVLFNLGFDLLVDEVVAESSRASSIALTCFNWSAPHVRSRNSCPAWIENKACKEKKNLSALQCHTAAVAAIVPVFFNDDFAVLLFFGDIAFLNCACEYSVERKSRWKSKCNLCLPRTHRNEKEIRMWNRN